MDKQNREVLVSQLANILGFQDGAEDIVEHLYAIESESDLSGYLQQLLGPNTDSSEFVKNVSLSKRGEWLLRTSTNTVESSNQQAQTQSAGANPRKPSSTSTSTGKLESLGAKTKPPPINNGINKKNTNTSTASSKKARAAPPLHAKKAPAPAEPASNQASASPKASPSNNVDDDKIAPVTPRRGQAAFKCGCFGTIHPCLTNCLYCGRIACEREGYSFCNFCGYQIEPPSSTMTKSDAFFHKDRLLRYDRETAQRTVVIDDQSDYYSNTNWMNEDERRSVEEKERQRQNALHRRGKQQIHFDF